ncbi:hypothetical protein P344_00180 [Spiroplasma mirum ATCC 29335]|uniref:Asparagine synthetase AsnA n=1 Tax=Spiroplasma mirum ATCC 29335 TaxID=838561 RepID=W0GN65_9MOLU|nr:MULTISPECIES: asparagine synthetase AsnA [Spiroplasma]AHF60508.1 aspartate--ammonia ligase [Spiroplasma mirum ATCC 29335]AHI57414.1 hypothetical protein P344_00180 [Spiroplasma mirum ATCC 29335]AKM52631.1 asparagine synthetase AsnA [Spiroplasma atrichopogonis]
MAHGIHIGYSSILTLQETIAAIALIKFELLKRFTKEFNLLEVDFPLICSEETGFNDDFRITERPVDFDIQPSGIVGEVLQSPNKWRRYVVKKYGIQENEGLLTFSNVLRRDIKQSDVNAVNFTEIGFDKLLGKNVFSFDLIHVTVEKVWECLGAIEKILIKKYDKLTEKFDKQFNWIAHNELEKSMRLLTYQERLNKYTRENGATVLYGLEEIIQDGILVPNESQDTFDWKLYAKIFVYNFYQEKAICIGYCGITVDKEVLKKQTTITKETNKIKTKFDAMIATNELPVTLSFGIYKSQLDLYLLEKQHISEVISSVWEDDFIEYAEKNEIQVL